MYIAIYVTAIVLICVGAIVFFVVKDKKNKKLSEKMKQQAKEETANDTQIAEVVEEDKLKENESLQVQKKSKILPQEQSELENFTLKFEPEKKRPEKNANLSPFNLDGNSDNEKRNENLQEDLDFDASDFEDFEEETNDDDLDKKFKEYEDFLKRNLDLDDDFEDDEFLKDAVPEEKVEFPPRPKLNLNNDQTDDLGALQNFDYDSLKGKSKEEIAEIIKSLPPKAQEILMSDILARRKFEDDEQ